MTERDSGRRGARAEVPGARPVVVDQVRLWPRSPDRTSGTPTSGSPMLREADAPGSERPAARARSAEPVNPSRVRSSGHPRLTFERCSRLDLVRQLRLSPEYGRSARPDAELLPTRIVVECDDLSARARGPFRIPALAERTESHSAAHRPPCCWLRPLGPRCEFTRSSAYAVGRRAGLMRPLYSYETEPMKCSVTPAPIHLVETPWHDRLNKSTMQLSPVSNPFPKA